MPRAFEVIELATFRRPQHDPGDERQALDRIAWERASQGKVTAETVSRVAPGGRFNSLNRTTLEQQATIFANMDAFEKAYSFARLDSAMQRQVLDRMELGDKAAFERIVAARADFEKTNAEALEAAPASTCGSWRLNQATLEQQSAMFANADVLEKVNSLFRVDAAMQKQIMEKMNANERQALDRIAWERASPGKVTAETLSRVAPGERFNSQPDDARAAGHDVRRC